MFKMQTENDMIAAVLHDVVEDTDWTTEKLEAEGFSAEVITCLLYTSDAADERSSVDLGGRRIIKKKKKKNV